MLRRHNPPNATSLHRLPAELIAKILLMTPGPCVPLSHISSYIRAVSLNTGALWSTIHVSGPNHMEKLAHHLKYSSNYLLHVFLTLDASSNYHARHGGFTLLDVAQIIRMISPSFSRVQRLTLDYNYWPNDQTSQMLQLFDIALPSLEALEITTRCNGPIPPTFLLGVTKKLTHVKIRIRGHLIQDPPQFLISETGLESLHLILEENLIFAVIPILQPHAFSLIKLNLDSVSTFPLHDGYSATPVVLESLDILHIRCGNATLLAAITAPRLRHLELEFYDEDGFEREPEESLENEANLIFDFLRHHAEHLDFVSYHTLNNPVEGGITEYSMEPIYFPKVHTFRIHANVGQRTLLSECRFPILAELVITTVLDLPDSDIPLGLVAWCIERNAHSLRSLEVNSEPNYRRGQPVHDTSPITYPINLPLIESITFKGGGNFLEIIATAPRLKTLIVNDMRPIFEIPTRLVFPSLEFLSVEKYPDILLSISAPILRTLKLVYSRDGNEDVMAFVHKHAASIEGLHLHQTTWTRSTDAGVPPTILLPQLQIAHFTQQYLLDPPFLLAVPASTWIQAQVTNIIAFDESVPIQSNIFPFKCLTVSYDGTESYTPPIIRSCPLLETLRIRIGTKGIPQGTPESNGIIFARSMGGPNRETGEWWCPSFRHLVLELPPKLSDPEMAHLLDMLIYIVKRRRAQPDVAPLESLKIGRAARPGLDPEEIISTWRSSSDKDRVINPTSQLHVWFKANLLNFECLCYPLGDPDWFF